MKSTVIVLLLGLILLGCVTPTQQAQINEEKIETSTPTPQAPQKPSATPKPTAKAPAVPKLDMDKTLDLIRAYTENPGWNNICRQNCELAKKLPTEVFCVASNNEKYATPIQLALGYKPKETFDYSQFSIRCNNLVPQVIFDCEAFERGILSCGSGLSGCQNGGYWLEFNRTKFFYETGYDVEPLVFVNSSFFKKVIETECSS